MPPSAESARLLRTIRIWITLFIIGLVLSGVTAFPLRWEIGILNQLFGESSRIGGLIPPLGEWISYVHRGVDSLTDEQAFLFYGTDWLAFAHLVIAVAFIGPWRDPVRNIWVIEFGLIACAMVIPLALICGSIRGIPFWWRLIDCSFGVFGAVPLLIVWRLIKRLEAS